MPWLKWWVGTASDPKFRMLAEECQLPVASVLGVWAYLLERAASNAERGHIPADLDMRLMAYTLQLTPHQVETVCNATKRDGLVTPEGEIAKWEAQQAKREKSEPPGASTKRVQALRERKKAQQNKDLGDGKGGNGGETDVTDETAGNGKKRHKKKSREEEDKEPKPPSSAGADGAEPFDQFWEAYPHKVDKIEARKVWAKLKPDAALLATILAAVEAQKAGDQWMRDNGQYIPGPARWLRAGRWLDVVRPYTPPPPKLPAGWWETREGIIAAGAMLNPPIVPRQGEYKEDVARRIREALGQVDPVAHPAPAAAPAAYEPPSVPEGVQLTDEQREARREELREQLRKMNQNAALARAGVPADA